MSYKDSPMADEKQQGGGFGEIVRTVVYAMVVALGIRSFAFEPFSIPSESMLPTLLVGDYLFVSKYAYGYSRYSLPFGLPLIPGRILSSPPKRGDVVVFKLPRDNSTDYIKRVIGLPGDRIQMKGGQLFINDKPVERRRITDFEQRTAFGTVRPVVQYQETLPNGVSYHTLELLRGGPMNDTGVYTVPNGNYFLMGDNRDNSLDSRVAVNEGGVGYVPDVNLVGRAEILFFSTDGSANFWEVWRWPQAIRWSRLLNLID